jgi:type I restriction enzyme, R subunit
MIGNTSEGRIERAFLDAMTGKSAIAASNRVKSTGAGGWIIGKSEHYDRARAMDLLQLTTFLEKAQRNMEAGSQTLDLQSDSPALLSFLNLLQEEISRRGVIDVLRRGIIYGQSKHALFYGHRSRFTQNQFSVIPKLQYSQDDSHPAVDLCLFVNGLPIATLELKDGLAKQSADDAIKQYEHHRASRDQLFQPGRCMAHFAVDEQQAYVCSELHGPDSEFLPFNQGSSERSGNPTSLFGIATDYLWRHTLTRPGVIDIIENYAQMMTNVDERTGEKRSVPVFPRFHQLEVVRRLLGDVESHNVGSRYLVQHSQGSGTSYSIAWLVSQLLYVEQDSVRIFDSIFVVTDRPSVERRLNDTVRNFARVSGRVGPDSGAPARIHELIENQGRIILASVDQFPLILDEIEAHQRGRRFAFVLDEAPSTEGVNATTAEVRINRAMFARVPLPNTSSFVFAPTTSETTLELFGEPYNDRGVTRYRPFHLHTD